MLIHCSFGLVVQKVGFFFLGITRQVPKKKMEQNNVDLRLLLSLCPLLLFFFAIFLCFNSLHFWWNVFSNRLNVSVVFISEGLYLVSIFDYDLIHRPLKVFILINHLYLLIIIPTKKKHQKMLFNQHFEVLFDLA